MKDLDPAAIELLEAKWLTELPWWDISLESPSTFRVDFLRAEGSFQGEKLS